MPDCYLISSRWCALVTRTCIRLGYRACAAAIIGLARMCADLASVMPTEMGLSLPLEQVVQGPLEVDSTPEPEAESREERMEERMEESEVEGRSDSEGMALDGELELEGSIEENEGEVEEDEGVEMDGDTRLEFWEWSHDWEDLEWVEEVWLENERVSADLNEATLPDEVWE